MSFILVLYFTAAQKIKILYWKITFAPKCKMSVSLAIYYPDNQKFSDAPTVSDR